METQNASVEANGSDADLARDADTVPSDPAAEAATEAIATHATTTDATTTDGAVIDAPITDPIATEPKPSYVKLAMRNMVRKRGLSLQHFFLTTVGLVAMFVGLAYLTR